MHIHYLILVHKNFKQVEDMIKMLNHKKASIYLHVDRKIKFNEFKGLKDINLLCEVKFVKNRRDIAWGGFNMVQATIDLMSLALKNKKEGYVVLLSGQDLPIKSNVDIYKFLNNNDKNEYIQYWSIPYDKWINGGIDRLNHYWFVDQIGLDESWKLYLLQKQKNYLRPYFDDLPPYGGSQWWCLTTACIKYILKFIRNNPVYNEFFSSTLIPDEMYFQTIVLNSQYANSVINDNLRHLYFEENHRHPVVFNTKDFSNIITSDKLWARKFDSEIDNEIVEMIKDYVNC